jgi:hypothetical protein
MGVPERPASNPEIVPGTSVRRSYVAPGAEDRPRLGDIVAWEGHQWDVVGTSLADRSVEAYAPTRLLLERLEGRGRRRAVVREHAPASEVAVVGRQVLLPGLPPAGAPERARDTG